MIDNNQVTNSGNYLERRHLQAVVGGVVEEMSRNERCREDGVRKGETQHCRVHARLGAFYQSGPFLRFTLSGGFWLFVVLWQSPNAT